MAKLKIVRQYGSVLEGEITPAVEYAFEQYAKMGFHMAFRTLERQTDVYWLAYECLRTSGETVPMFGAEFLDTLAKVEVLDDLPLA